MSLEVNGPFLHQVELELSGGLMCNCLAVSAALVCWCTERVISVISHFEFKANTYIYSIHDPYFSLDFSGKTLKSVLTEVRSIESKLDSMADLSRLKATLKSLNDAPGSRVVDGESCGVAAVCVIIGSADDSVIPALLANIFDS